MCQSIFQSNVMFQQNGASQHWSSDVRRSLDKTFLQQWIGRDGHPRSPDITPLDFYLWNYVKDRSCYTYRDACDLRHIITETINSVIPFRWTKIEY
ncbi:hypothetical protein CEXT_254571 [Caerostris extrusa]|uniref:Uncharacterized protein n=1 Tax=Caerostris extrusa TaxID=172846 RepID=A0AAV4NQ45_CAEEX|nr:hypothetical protein CEXT_254571 [Caerostris extrusa]